MPRVKRGTGHVKRRRNILKQAKGYRWGRKNKIKNAKEAVVKAGVHAYIDRRKKKRDNRALWQIRIGAFAKTHGISYSRLMDSLKKSGIALDRKILADLAKNHRVIMEKVLSEVSVK